MNTTQRIMIAISFIIITTVAGVSIYYGSPILTEPLQNRFLIVLTRIMTILVTLWVAGFTLNYVVKKLKGVY